jgi:hypothetical protein
MVYRLRRTRYLPTRYSSLWNQTIPGIKACLERSVRRCVGGVRFCNAKWCRDVVSVRIRLDAVFKRIAVGWFRATPSTTINWLRWTIVHLEPQRQNSYHRRYCGRSGSKQCSNTSRYALVQMNARRRRKIVTKPIPYTNLEIKWNGLH